MLVIETLPNLTILKQFRIPFPNSAGGLILTVLGAILPQHLTLTLAKIELGAK